MSVDYDNSLQFGHAVVGRPDSSKEDGFSNYVTCVRWLELKSGTVRMESRFTWRDQGEKFDEVFFQKALEPERGWHWSPSVPIATVLALTEVPIGQTVQLVEHTYRGRGSPSPRVVLFREAHILDRHIRWLRSRVVCVNLGKDM